MITIELPPEAEKQLEEAARETGKDAKAWAEEVILNYLEDLEDIRDAEAVLKDIAEGRQKTTSLEDLMKEYGMEH